MNATAGQRDRAEGELARSDRFLDIFLKTIAMTSRVLDHQEVMETVVRELPGLLDADACTIRLLDESTRSFVLGAAHGVSMEYLTRETIDTEQTLEMVQAGYPVYTDHVDEEALLPFYDAARREGIKAVLSLPILFQEQVIGIMRLLSKSATRNFSSEEISCAMALAMQTGIAIAHGRMFKEQQVQLGFLRELQVFSRLVNSSLDLNHTLSVMAKRAVESLDAKGCTLRLVDPASKRLYLAASHGLSEAYLHRGQVESERGIQLVLAGEPVAIYDACADRRVDYAEQMRAEGIVSLLAVPLQVQGEIIGVMRVLTSTSRVFTDAEIRFASTLAEVGGTAIHNARNYQKISNLLIRIEGHEKFLATIIDSLQHQLIVFNQDHRIALANKQFLAAIDRPEEEVIGMHYGELCRNEEACPVNQVFAGLAVQPMTEELRSDTGSQWFERSASPIKNERGHVEYVIEIIRNITAERRLAEAEVEQGRLSGIVELAGTVAHEINSPLFAALGTAELLADDEAAGGITEELQVVIRNLQRISELTKKMTSMTGFKRKQYVGESTVLSLEDDNQ